MISGVCRIFPQDRLGSNFPLKEKAVRRQPLCSTVYLATANSPHAAATTTPSPFFNYTVRQDSVINQNMTWNFENEKYQTQKEHEGRTSN